MTNTWIISLMNCLERMGLTAAILQSKIDKTKSTTLRFQAAESCEFVREITLQVPMDRTIETVETTETETAGNSPANGAGVAATTTKSTISRVVNNIKEYHWKVDVQWELYVYSGTNVENTKAVLQNRSSQMHVVIQSNPNPPVPTSNQVHEPLDVSLTWLMQQINNEALTAQFKIDTDHSDTKTPSRNPQITDSLEFLKNLSQWTKRVRKHMNFLQYTIVDKHNPATGPLSSPTSSSRQATKFGQIKEYSQSIFNPIQPLMEEPPSTDEDVANEMSVDHKSVLSWGSSEVTTDDGDEENDEGRLENRKKSSPLLSTNDMNMLLNEQIRSLDEKMDSLQIVFPDNGDTSKIISVAEAMLYLLCEHGNSLNLKYVKCVQYVENMLERQLIAAIGKRVTSADLDKFVKFHNAKLLKPAPVPFCRPIRRPDHHPEGILSIEDKASKGEAPIETFMREVKMQSSLKLPLNAAATVELMGQIFLHGWLRHRFQEPFSFAQQQHKGKSYQIGARARQFSSFILVVGTMVGPDKLMPQDAIILQNKDEVSIPLLLEEIPSAKEFKDAIKSLSPEQQRFAKAFRGMQLESSVLGICVIQIKPQLENLLGLPSDSLTKEMKLTQYLMKLFLEYQVPSDLLSYDGVDPNATKKDKVDNVKSNVQNVVDVIDAGKVDDWEAGAMRATAAAFQSAEAYYGGGGHVDAASFASSPAPVAFGAPQAPVAGGFGIAPTASPFGSAPPQSGSGTLFGAPPPASPPAAMGLFGGSPAPMAKNATPVSAPPPESRSGFAFGSPATSSSEAMTTSSADGGGQNVAVERRRQIINLCKVGNGSAQEDSKQGGGEDAAHDAEVPLVDDSQSAQEQGSSHNLPDLLSSTTKADGEVNFTMLPKALDAVVEKHDADGAMRSTVIKTGPVWDRNRKPNLLLPSSHSKLGAKEIKSENDKAFDLLDALSRSGTLPISCSELHVVVCLTHCFEKDVVGTIIKDNINPIEKLEMSTILLASAIHGVAPQKVIRDPKDTSRLSTSFPEIMN